MNVGDTVSWSSQAGGYSKRKVGTIVQIVEPGFHTFVTPFSNTHDLNTLSGGRPRNKVSYLVEVKEKGKKPKLYWPKAHQTRRKKAEVETQTTNGTHTDVPVVVDEVASIPEFEEQHPDDDSEEAEYF